MAHDKTKTADAWFSCIFKITNYKTTFKWLLVMSVCSYILITACILWPISEFYIAAIKQKLLFVIFYCGQMSLHIWSNSAYWLQHGSDHNRPGKILWGLCHCHNSSKNSQIWTKSFLKFDSWLCGDYLMRAKFSFEVSYK